jgi:predicted alpha/beta superfamily hydrolase
LKPSLKQQKSICSDNHLADFSHRNFIEKPEMFNNYFIISPSLWWDDESLLKQAPQLLSKSSDTKKFVYVSVGKGEHPVMVKDAENFMMF